MPTTTQYYYRYEYAICIRMCSLAPGNRGSAQIRYNVGYRTGTRVPEMERIQIDSAVMQILYIYNIGTRRTSIYLFIVVHRLVFVLMLLNKKTRRDDIIPPAGGPTLCRRSRSTSSCSYAATTLLSGRVTISPYASHCLTRLDYVPSS